MLFKLFGRSRRDKGELAKYALKVEDLRHRYGKKTALDGVDLEVAKGEMIAIIGHDGVGKSTLLSVALGIRKLQEGSSYVLGHDVSKTRERRLLSQKISFMPQGLGKNLYPTLTVMENISFFASLHNLKKGRKEKKIKALFEATGLSPFTERPAGKLSGGMKQKLSLCCALMNNPELLVLDEPTTGVDPLSRRQFWNLIREIKRINPELTVIVTTAYMDEAMLFDRIVAMNGGKKVADGALEDLLRETGSHNLEEAFSRLLGFAERGEELPGNSMDGNASVGGASESGNPDSSHDLSGTLAKEKKNLETIVAHAGNGGVGADSANGGAIQSGLDGVGVRTPRDFSQEDLVIRARNLTKRFGDFTAVDDVSFDIRKGEIFGFLGSNGCGKSTTMKMLTGLLDPTMGEATVMGRPVGKDDIEAKMDVGYMSQAFSLYEDLTLKENLVLHGDLYHMERSDLMARIKELSDELDLTERLNDKPTELSLGLRQRLQLVAAILHRPKLLILDEPTSGVDPEAREKFWQMLEKLSREEGVTIFVSTHFMNEATKCDRISFMHRSKVLAVGSPEELAHSMGANNLEEAFVRHILLAEKSMDREAIEEAKARDEARMAKDAAKGKAAAMEAQASGASEANPVETAQAAAQSAAAGEDFDVTPPRVDPEIFGGGEDDLRDGVANWFSVLYAFAYREFIELARDKIRLGFALFGSMIIMLVTSTSFNFDVREVKIAAVDEDRTAMSSNLLGYFNGVAGFTYKGDFDNLEDAEKLMQKGGAHVILRIPENFARDVLAGSSPELPVYIDGSSVFVGQNFLNYFGSIMTNWYSDLYFKTGAPGKIDFSGKVEPRFVYNQSFRSADVMSPLIISIFLIIISGILGTLSVVREKEIGSIVNFYTSPATRAQFILGKQIPYILVMFLNFVLMFLCTVYILKVPFKGSITGLMIGGLLFIFAGTAFGLLISTMIKRQLPAVFASALIINMTASDYSGFVVPISNMDPGQQAVALSFPSSWFHYILVGSYAKGNGVAELAQYYWPLLLIGVAYITASILFMSKREK